MFVKTKSVEDRNTLIQLFVSLGIFFHDDEKIKDVGVIERKYSFKEFPIIRLHTRANPYISGCGSNWNNDVTHTWPQDANEIIKTASGTKTIKIENVGEYTATVTKQGVSVGCQVISLEKVKEIYEATLKVS